MRQLAVMVGAGMLIAAAAQAQIPQGLGAADPSQQLKTSGMQMNYFQQQIAQPTRTDEKKEPLVSGTAEAAGDTQPQTIAGQPVQQAPAAAPAPAPATAVAPANAAAGAPADDRKNRRNKKDRRHARDEARANPPANATPGTAMPDRVQTAAPAAPADANAAAALAPATAPHATDAGTPADERMQRIQDLINQIKSHHAQ